MVTLGDSKQAGQFSAIIGKWLSEANDIKSLSRAYTNGRIIRKSFSLSNVLLSVYQSILIIKQLEYLLVFIMSFH